MFSYISMRSFNTGHDAFTGNPASKVRFVSVPDPKGAANRESIVSQAHWAQNVAQTGDGADILLLVHGFNTSQLSMQRSAQTSARMLKDAGFNGMVAGLDWPTYEAGGSISAIKTCYRTSKSNVHKVYFELFSTAVRAIAAEFPNARIHVLAHSMGAYLTLTALNSMRHDDGPGGQGQWMDQLIFTAADEHFRLLGAGTGHAGAVSLRSARFTNYYSIKDMVLDLSKLLNGFKRRVGSIGISKGLTPHFYDVDCAQRYEDQADKTKDEIRPSHNWYYTDRNYWSDVAQVLNRVDVAQMNSRKKRSDGDYQLR